MGVDDTARKWRHSAERLVTLVAAALEGAMRQLDGFAGHLGIGAITAGVWLQFGMNYGLITAGALLILNALT